MKKFIYLFLFLSAAVISAQIKVTAVKADETTSVSFPKDKPVDVRLMFPDLDKKTDEYLQANPDGLLPDKLGKASWTFTVGSTKNWYSIDLTSTSYTPYLVPSTCRAVGTHCYIFVEDASWTSGKVNAAAVTAVQNAFDNATPANSSKGIYQTDVDIFGNPPDKDGDSKIIILILDIKDGYSAGKAYTAGYFYSLNETNGNGSNQAEIYFLDCNPLDLTTSDGIKEGMSTAAHEFQHMIMYNYHSSPSQTTFMNEGCSLIAEYICGYDFREQTSFAGDGPLGLFDWNRSGTNDVLKDYSRAARFMLYMYEQFGSEFLTKFVQSSFVKDSGINDALSKLTTTTSRRFLDILVDWYYANLIDNKTYNSKWGYTLTGLDKPEGTVYWNANTSSTAANVPYLGARIITHKGSSSLNSTFAPTGSFASSFNKPKAIKLGSGAPVVEDVTYNSAYSTPSLAGVYNTVQYVTVNTNLSSDYTVNYSSSGTNPVTPYEFKWDTDGTTAYILYLDANYRQAVVFNPALGCKLSSVKVAMRNNNNPLTMEIYTYTGTKSAPLGTKLVSSTTVTNTSTGGAWISVPLSTYNISLNQSIVVVFKMTITSNSGSLGNTVLVDAKSGVAYYYSLVSADGSYFEWASDGTDTYLNRIRAYGEAIVGTEKEIELTPKEYTLAQNYPNPFNPSTKIQFSLPEAGRVAIRIYDMLGREVKTLINGEQNAGTHEVVWNGDDEAGHKVATGVYMYAISTNKFVQTKKMILLK